MHFCLSKTKGLGNPFSKYIASAEDKMLDLIQFSFILSQLKQLQEIQCEKFPKIGREVKGLMRKMAAFMGKGQVSTELSPLFYALENCPVLDEF